MAKEKVVEEGPNKSDAVREVLKSDPKMPSKKVIDTLAARGISVSLPLVNKIKYAKPGDAKPAAGKARRGRPSGGVNVSEKIREYIVANPSATRPQIRDAMVAAGHTVSVSLIAAVFNRVHEGGTKPAGRRGRPPASASAAAKPAGKPGRPAAAPKAAAPKAAAPASSGSLSASDLVSAKQLVDSFGGADRVREALALLEQLR